MTPESGHVYFLVMKLGSAPDHDFGLVKVGITAGDPLRRVAKLQTGNPYGLACFDSFSTPWPRQVEHFLHRSHAEEMQQGEWLKCGRDQLPALVLRAKAIARQIDERKSKEQPYLSQESNGQTRRATSDEFDIHVQSRRVLKELLPAKLRLKAADYRLKAATGATFGIRGIVTVKYLPAGIRFSARLAGERFPNLVADCTVSETTGVFRWRNVPLLRQFPECQVAQAEERAAALAVERVLQANSQPSGWTERTTEFEESHDLYLRMVRTVHRLTADLEDLRTELILRLGEYEALDPICSFKRVRVPRIDRPRFIKEHPAEAEQCATYVPPRLRKNIYPSRSYV
ncbi:MAG TPA: GIY-YIG nuclease family protein [Vicinamibacterales bacterium]|nr:GIY-YIG nuclease family protein [Vicinamibacterales bacterium]